MINKLALLFLLFLCSTSVYSSTLSGADSTYANTEIVLLKPADPFTGEVMELGRIKANNKGVFNLKVDITETTYTFLYLGIYKAVIYIEKDKEYIVALPARMDLGQEEKLNPFFQRSIIQLGIINADQNDLNLQILMFDDSFYPYFNKHTQKVFSDNLDFEQLDKDIEQLDKPFSKSKNQYFNEYRKYKYGMLRFIAYQHKSKSVSDLYFKGQPFLANNPAYVELFNMVYTEYFSYFGRTEVGKQLAPAISNKSYAEVKRVLSHDEVLQPPELLNMVLLKGLHDEFYDDNYSRSSMLAILDSMLLISKNPLEITTAKSIRKKVVQLLVGFEPPAFLLYDIDSNLVSLDKFKGKFVYLNFCSCFSYTCLNEFAMLQNIYRKHNKYLEIVTIVMDDNVEVMRDFVKRSGYEWTFLHFDNTPTIFQDYDVRAFPTYYLIDDEGKLSMSPAPTPNEEFEGRLFKVLRAKGIL
jgi:peroxiredoxin